MTHDSPGGRIPDFFVIGAPKAGTTSLYRWLGQHPDIFMSPIKEPCFFAPEVVDYTPVSRRAYETDAPALRAWLDGPMTMRRGHGIVLDWSDYLSLFRHAGDAVAAGEVSGNYLHSPGAPRRIRERIPGARIVMVLRDPAERLFSHYASALAAGQVRGDFSAWVDEQMRAESKRDPRFGPIHTGMYATHLRCWLASFPLTQVRVHFYEDYRDSPETVLNDIFDFVGVDTCSIDTTIRHNVTMIPRWPLLHSRVAPARALIGRLLPDRARRALKQWYRRPPELRIPRAERSRLISVYRDEIIALQDLARRDLSLWLAVEGGEA